MKIAMFGQKRIPSREGGVEIVVEELSTRMAMAGHDVTCYNRRGHHVSGSEYDTKEKKEYKNTYSVAYYFLLIAMLGIGNHGNRSVAAVRDDREKLNKTFSSIYSLQVITFSIAILAYAIYLVLFVKDNRLIVLVKAVSACDSTYAICFPKGICRGG